MTCKARDSGGISLFARSFKQAGATKAGGRHRTTAAKWSNAAGSGHKPTVASVITARSHLILLELNPR